MSRRPARATQADIARSIRAAEQVGHGHVVEIAPDGTIRIIPANQNIHRTVDDPVDDGAPIEL